MEYVNPFESSKKDAFIICLEHPLGIGAQPKKIIPSLLVIRCKAIDAVMVLDAVPIVIGIGRMNGRGRKSPASKSAALFFAPFFWASKERRSIAQAKKVNRLIPVLFEVIVIITTEAVIIIFFVFLANGFISIV